MLWNAVLWCQDTAKIRSSAVAARVHRSVRLLYSVLRVKKYISLFANSYIASTGHAGGTKQKQSTFAFAGARGVAQRPVRCVCVCVALRVPAYTALRRRQSNSAQLAS